MDASDSRHMHVVGINMEGRSEGEGGKKGRRSEERVKDGEG